MAAAAKSVAIILGAGPGLGASLCNAFVSRGLIVAAGSRSGAPALEGVAGVHRFSVDGTDQASVNAFVTGAEALGPIEVAVFNSGGGDAFVVKSILELDASEIERQWRNGFMGGFYLGQAVAKAMVPRSRGTIIFTGATASTRGSAKFAALAVPKFGLKALAQSMARELGPAGLHVAHVILDGPIDLASTTAKWGPPALADSRLSPDAIAASYAALHEQHRSAWTFELDLRPYCEKF